MSDYDVRAKIKEILRILKRRSFSSANDLENYILGVAENSKLKSAFRRPVGQDTAKTSYVHCSLANIRGRVRLCEELGLVSYVDGLFAMLPYEPIIESGVDLDKLIERRLIAYFERHGVTFPALRTAIDSLRTPTATAIWGKLPNIRLGKDKFVQRLHLLSQVGSLVKPHRGKTYDYL